MEMQNLLLVAVGGLSTAVTVLWRYTALGFKKCDEDRRKMWNELLNIKRS